MHELIKQLITWYQQTLDAGGYTLVAALMAMESTVVPIPSEVIIPFAAQRAHEKGAMTLAGVVIAGTIGSWVGATIMYWASRLAGRPLALRYGRYVMVPEEKIHAAERWARRFGSAGVFIARLLPVVRHLIGIPMGIVKMDFKLYSIFTLIGSGIWCSVLAWLGVAVSTDPDVVKGDVYKITIWVVGVMVVIALMYYFLVHRFMKKDEPSAKPKP